MAISFIDIEQHGETTSSLTITVPTNAQTGDLIIAVLAGNGDDTSAPNWTYTFSDLTGIQYQHFEQSSTNKHSFQLFYRILQEGDPSSFSGSRSAFFVDNSTSISTLAYRGVDSTTPVLGSNSAVAGELDAGLSSGTVNNTDSGAWAVGFGGVANFQATNIGLAGGDPTTQRGTDHSVDNGDAATTAVFDSNGSVATGDRSVSVSDDQSIGAGYSAIVLLTPSAGAPHTDANAGNALGTGTANNAAGAASVNAGNAPGTGVANDPTVTAVDGKPNQMGRMVVF